MEKKYSDFTSYEALLTSNAYPKEDENKNPLETEFGKCVYKDHQVFSIQVILEKNFIIFIIILRSFQSRHLLGVYRGISMSLVWIFKHPIAIFQHLVDDDLADRCKPGDRVRVIALFRVLPNKQAGMSTGNFRF